MRHWPSAPTSRTPICCGLLAGANAKGTSTGHLADANSAIKLNDRNAAAYGLRGKILEQKGEADAALGDYNLSLSLDSDSPYGYLTRALWYQNRGETALATKDLMEADAAQSG